MPFIGQDWRAPGETWIRTDGGWERMKLRPYGSFSESASSSLGGRSRSDSDMTPGIDCEPAPRSPNRPVDNRCRYTSSSSSNEDVPIFTLDNAPSPEPDVVDFDDLDDWQPHCFVKTGKSKEFVGCTSISEAFHKLDLARAVTDVQRFNYVCKVVQILIQDKLQNLSGSARRILLSVVQAIVLHCIDTYSEVTTVRVIVEDFVNGLSGGQHCGSPQLLFQHQGTVSSLYEILCTKQPGTPAESAEESVTFLDLPRECIRAVLRRLPDHRSLLEAAKAHEALQSVVESERRLWEGLCTFHFSQWQLDATRQRLKDKQTKQRAKDGLADSDQADNDKDPLSVNWRHAYFELKKFYGLKEVYADMIHICCHCKGLFWKSLGHPCVTREAAAPSVRVTPQQFVAMLMFL